LMCKYGLRQQILAKLLEFIVFATYRATRSFGSWTSEQLSKRIFVHPKVDF